MRQLTPRRRDSLWDFMSEVERAFDSAWTEAGITAPTSAAAWPEASFTPAVDLHESPEFYLISLDLPGIDQKDIKIDVQEGRLMISGERRREDRKEDGMFKRFERSYGRFERSFQLPQNVDQDNIKARYENGVLEVMVPKTQMAKPRNVQIESGKGGLFSRLLGQKNVETKSEKSEH